MTTEAAELFSMYGEVREKYSGKGMYGKETTGIVFESQKQFFLALADLIHEYVADQNFEEATYLTDTLKTLRTDNIGTRIIYY